MGGLGLFYWFGNSNSKGVSSYGNQIAASLPAQFIILVHFSLVIAWNLMNKKIQSEPFFTPFLGERGRSLNYFFSLSKKSSIWLAWQWHRISQQLFQRVLQTTELSVWETGVSTSTLWRVMWISPHSLRWEHVSFNIKLIANIFLIHHSNNDIMSKGWEQPAKADCVVGLQTKQTSPHILPLLIYSFANGQCKNRKI